MAEATAKKNRLMIKCTDGGTINIAVDKIKTMEDDENYIIALNEGEIVGIFDLGAIQTLYMQ